jgi:circadian clock protein KaiC
MAEPEDATRRLSTGVSGLDAIVGGGLAEGGIYIVSGRPGAGKTILSNQLAYTHAAKGGRVVFTTLLAETHARLLAQLRMLSFFDEAKVGREVVYLNGLTPTLESGLAGLLQLVRQMVRDHGATLLVIDGMVTASALAPSPLEYKRFVADLQTWISIVGCTVVLVTSGSLDGEVAPEHTMVDGIIELRCERRGLRTFRYVAVTKLRGCGFVEGSHSYLITPDGLRVYPRFEARPMPEPSLEVVAQLGQQRLSLRDRRLDAALGGGVVRGSTTLVLGPSGTGKTVLALQFLAEGTRLGEPCLYFGFFEPPAIVLAKAERFGFELTSAVEAGSLHLRWRRPSETFLDAVADEILQTVIRYDIQRLVVDGFAGFHSSGESERVAAVFATLVAGLAAHGVTVFVTDETRELFVQEVEIPTPNVSALFHNILFVRRVETDSGDLERTLAVMKTRDSRHDSCLLEVAIEQRGLVVVGPKGEGSGTTIARGKHSTRGATAPKRKAAKTRARPSKRRGRGR